MLKFSKIMLVPALAFALGSCSSGFDITAAMVGDDVVFFADTDMFGRQKCVNHVSVRIQYGPAATAAPGDHAAVVRKGTYWEKSVAIPHCKNYFPLRYGAPLVGPNRTFRNKPAISVAPKPLLRGVVYDVQITSGSTAYGSGQFRINADGTVENLPK